MLSLRRSRRHTYNYLGTNKIVFGMQYKIIFWHNWIDQRFPNYEARLP